MNANTFRRSLLAVVLATLALAPAKAQEAPRADPAPADFSGKYLCVEDDKDSWAVEHAHVAKVGSREFLVGDQVPPPPEDKVVVADEDKKEDKKENAKEDHKTAKKDKKEGGKHPVSAAHCRTMIPLDKIHSIQVFDSEKALNDYFDSLDDAGGAQDDGPVVY